jgi:uncharacterized membrane protein YfcA
VTFSVWQWIALAVGALLVGLSKSGIPGIGILSIAIFTNILDAKASTGLVLPLLIVGDVVAVVTYRQHTLWKHVWRLFPWTAAGVIAGYFALERIDNRQAKILIGVILFFMLGLHVWRNCQAQAAKIEHAVAGHAIWFAPFTGIMAGFTTQVANAAGPVMIIYLLAMRLPKMEFLGTGAVFFMLLNWFKVPFMIHLHMITADSLVVNLWLAPAVVGGALLGRAVAMRIPQKLFERIALVLTFVAAAKLLWDALAIR